MKRQELLVAALESGTVIDHIPSSKLFEVVNLLHLEQMKTSITVGYNLKSKKMGHKSIIKIAGKFFSDEELNQLEVFLPEELKGIVKCANPKCITNNEPMKTYFHAVPGKEGVLRCHYCNKEVDLDHVKLV